MPRPILAPALIAFVLALSALPATAQETPGSNVERCPRFFAGAPGADTLPGPRIQNAAFTPQDIIKAQATRPGPVGIRFIGHASFWIESPGGVTIHTDYSNGTRTIDTPVIATMNIAHSTHHTFTPDPGIAHLLPGWGDGSKPADYELEVKDVLVRNVTTNLRSMEFGSTERDRNSIFVFETAMLCIAHLGHLHHPLTEDHLASLGPVNIVLAPVDGSYTLNQTDMFETLKDLGAPVIIPMHYFAAFNLERFLTRAAEEGYAIDRRTDPSMTISFETLPKEKTVIVLPGR